MSANQSVQQLLAAGFSESGITAFEYDIALSDTTSLCVWFEDGEVSDVYIDNFGAGIEYSITGTWNVDEIIKFKNSLLAQPTQRPQLYVSGISMVTCKSSQIAEDEIAYRQEDLK